MTRYFMAFFYQLFHGHWFYYSYSKSHRIVTKTRLTWCAGTICICFKKRSGCISLCRRIFSFSSSNLLSKLIKLIFPSICFRISAFDFWHTVKILIIRPGLTLFKRPFLWTYFRWGLLSRAERRYYPKEFYVLKMFGFYICRRCVSKTLRAYRISRGKTLKITKNSTQV